jgi:Na+-driven multidrug efflux pump
MLGNTDQLAAQVIVVAIAEFSIMVPYGLSLGAVTLVGQSLGAGKADEAKANSWLVAKFAQISAAVFCICMILLREPLIHIYT